MSMSLLSPIVPSPISKTHSENNILYSVSESDVPLRSLMFVVSVRTSIKFQIYEELIIACTTSCRVPLGITDSIYLTKNYNLTTELNVFILLVNQLENIPERSIN